MSVRLVHLSVESLPRCRERRGDLSAQVKLCVCVSLYKAVCLLKAGSEEAAVPNWLAALL